MSHDDFTSALSELQGSVSELTSCALTGRRTDEAMPQMDASRRRAADLAAELRRRANMLEAAVDTSLRIVGAISREAA